MLTILSNPSNSCSVTSEMLFVINESTKANDPVNYTDYKYILDVYVAGDLISRIIATPDPDHYFGVFDLSKILQQYVPAYGFNISTDIVDYDVSLEYQCKLGEEYNGTRYLNVVTDSARTTFRTYKDRPFTSSSLIANGLASNMPDVITSLGNPVDYNIIPFYSNVTGISDLVATYKDKDGNTLDTATFDNSTFVAGKIRQVNVANSSKQTDHVLFTGPFSLRINYECSKYPVHTLVWLNPFGAYESQTFGLVSKRSIELSRKSFASVNYRVDNSGNVTYLANGVFYGSKKVYANSIKTRLKLTSHLLSDDEYEWLEDLFKSTDILIHTSVGFIPVQITSTTYDRRTYLNSRLTPLELEVEFSDDYNAQFL
jgi:hypothetical protein